MLRSNIYSGNTEAGVPKLEEVRLTGDEAETETVYWGLGARFCDVINHSLKLESDSPERQAALAKAQGLLCLMDQVAHPGEELFVGITTEA